MTDQEKLNRIEEIKKILIEKKNSYDYYKAAQLAFKLIINGSYGGFANPFFVCSNSNIANAITAHGRDVIQYMLKKIENYFYNEWHLDYETHKKLGFTKVEPLDKNPQFSTDENGLYHYVGNNPVTIYGDTDSVASDTIIRTNTGTFTIEDLYNRNIINGSAGITLNGHESVSCNDKVLNWDKELYYAPVKRIIRHKVTKEKWLLKTKSGKEILVTNDHSMIVFRDGIKLEIKPRDILKTDKILIVIVSIPNFVGLTDTKITTETSTYWEFDDIETCECIGMFEDEYVYDIEIDDDTHTFIANDLLVHNSLYISYTPIMKSVGFQHIEDLQKGRQFILDFYNNFVRGLFNGYLDEYAKPYKVKNLHDFELETICKSALFIEKKNYLNNVVWEDGSFYDDMTYFYPKGIEIVRSSTPSFVRGYKGNGGVFTIIRYIFQNPNNLNINNIIKLVKDMKKEFIMADIESISMTTSCSNYKDKVLDDYKQLNCVTGAHFGVKAAAFHNYLLNNNYEYKGKYDLIKSGRIKYYYCKHSLNSVFAYPRSFHPIEIVQKENVLLDVDVQFEKTVLQIVNKFLKPLGLPLINKRISVLNSLFSKK